MAKPTGIPSGLFATENNMDFFDFLTFVGGVSLFLFGMNYLGGALEKKAGGSLSLLLQRFTSNKFTGFLLGLVVTMLIQSSSATTVIVVGLVNSGVMTLSQSVGVIIGANVGTTATAWILSLTGIGSGSFVVRMLKPSSFVPILALIGVILYIFIKNSKKKDLGMILLGFSVLMFGMDAASGAVSGLGDIPQFAELFVLFKNPILGLLAGAALTAVLQSSSASVGILQALCMTGKVSIGAALPIILGQNIGTCITAMVSSIGADKNAKRAAVVHLSFNALGSILVMLLFYPLNHFMKFGIVDEAASTFSIAVIHTLCNLVSTLLFLPFSAILERVAVAVVRDSREQPIKKELILDERLFINPSVAIEQSRRAVMRMAHEAIIAFSDSVTLVDKYDEEKAARIKEDEERIDKYEDIIDTYLVKLNSQQLTEENSRELTKLLHVTAGFERISDHAVHMAIHAKDVSEKKLALSGEARNELKVITKAVLEAIDMTTTAFCENNLELASSVEPLEQVVDKLTVKAKSKHIQRMLKGECDNETGLAFSDLLAVLERVSDHCSDIAASLVEIPLGNMDIHEYIHGVKTDSPEFAQKYKEYKTKYVI